MKLSILSFTGYYLPAYKAGGPVKTMANMVDNLSEIDFHIVTRDRDLGDATPFSQIDPDVWQKVGSANVLYLSHNGLSFFNLIRTVKATQFDVLYLNSYFDFHFSIKVLIAVNFYLRGYCPIVLAPRGEFSRGALGIKSFKKRMYLKVASFLGLYRGVTWQASSEYERNDIVKNLSVAEESVFIAKDLPERVVDTPPLDDYHPADELKIVFLSRISPMKNLDFALQILSQVKCAVIFDIYGPKEDVNYWQHCYKLITSLPDNISVNYCGAINSKDVRKVFSRYDMFFFPTRGENYGHVIAESLSVGTPVLISDQTPWRELSSDCLGWDLPLEAADIFLEKIHFMAKCSPSDRFAMRNIVRARSLARIVSEDDIADNKRLFEFAYQRFKENKV